MSASGDRFQCALVVDVLMLVHMFVRGIPAVPASGVTGLGAGTGPNVVAWVAHMGGYFVGLLLAGPFDRLAKR